MMDTALLRVSNAEFWDFVQQPENADKRYELHNGVIIEMPSPAPLHNVVSTLIASYLTFYGREHQLGYAFGDNTDYELAEDIVFKPDASFIGKERLPRGLPKRFTFAPDIAVEVVSPSNTPTDILYKVETYIRYGTKLVWVFYPKDQNVLVYRKGEGRSLNVTRLTLEDTLDGGDVLVGFALRLADFFAQIPPEEEE